MSFYTSLRFYRPTPPPVVSGREFLRFLHDLCSAGVFEARGATVLQIKFGRTIDQDEKSTMVEVPLEDEPGVSLIRDIDWDVDEPKITLEDAAEMLKGEDRAVYRAFAFIGTVNPAITAALQTRRPDDGEENLALWDGSVSIGPVRVCSLGGDREFQVGWMDVGIGGNGYLWPWTARDLTDRAARLPDLEPLTQVCRSSFPIDPNDRSPTFKAKRWSDVLRSRRRGRRQMGALWPHDDLDVPADWHWGVAETG
jgi:hypothetical protein